MVIDRRTILASSLLLPLGMAARLDAGQHEPSFEKQTETYASPGGHDLRIDLYLPKVRRRPLPVILFVHGGAWFIGDRTTAPDLGRYFAADGFCMASIDYRPSTAIPFPGNLEDVRTAVRWLRANASALGLNPRKIGLWGTSAGGHLVSLAGLAPQSMFEGSGHLEQSSDVQCVLEGYGVTDLLHQDEQSARERPSLQLAPANIQAAQMEALAAGGKPPSGGPNIMVPMNDPNSIASWLVGGPLLEKRAQAIAASPLTYARRDAPPFLIMHGLADRSVPHQQSIALYDALTAKGSDVTLRLIDRLPHTFFNIANVDELAGPYEMTVQRHPRGGQERKWTEMARIFDTARAFFRAQLM